MFLLPILIPALNSSSPAFLFLKNFIHLFIFVRARSLLYEGFFSSCGEWGLLLQYGEWGLLSSCGARASHCGGFSCCRAWAFELAGFSSAWAQ